MYVSYCLEKTRFYPDYRLAYNKFYIFFSCIVSCEFFKICDKFFLPCYCKSLKTSQTYRALSLNDFRLIFRLDLLPSVQVMLNIWKLTFTLIRISNLTYVWLIVNICHSRQRTYFYGIHKLRAFQKMKLHPETECYLKRSYFIEGLSFACEYSHIYSSMTLNTTTLKYQSLY
jgi:hypothetical protein